MPDKTLKAWFIYYGNPGWFHCVMIFSNGWVPFGHLCSHPNFAPGDLWIGRKERMEIVEKMGIKVEIQPGVHEGGQFLLSHPDVDQNHKNKENWEALNVEYKAIEDAMRIEEAKK